MKKVELKRIAEILWRGTPPDEKTPFAQATVPDNGSIPKTYDADDNKKPEKEFPADEGGKIEGPMSVPRKLIFAMSFNVWILYFLVLGWFIPCRNLECGPDFGVLERTWNLTDVWPLTDLEAVNVAGLPSLAMFGYANGSILKIAALRTDEGEFEWNNNLDFRPTKIQCKFEMSFDANGDGMDDCLLTGNSEIYAFNASNGYVFWQRTLPAEDGNIISRFHPTSGHAVGTYLIGTSGDQVILLDARNGTKVFETDLPCWSPFNVRIVPNGVSENFTLWSIVCDYGYKVEIWAVSEEDLLSGMNSESPNATGFTLLFSSESNSPESIDLGCDVTPIPGGPLLLSWSDRVAMVTPNATAWERRFPYPLTVASLKVGFFTHATELHAAAAVRNGTNTIVYILEMRNGSTVASVLLKDKEAQSMEIVKGDIEAVLLRSVYLNFTSQPLHVLSDPVPMEKTNFALIEYNNGHLDVTDVATAARIAGSTVSRKINGESDLLVVKIEDDAVFFQKYVLRRSKSEDGLFCARVSHPTHFSSEM